MWNLIDDYGQVAFSLPPGAVRPGSDDALAEAVNGFGYVAFRTMKFGVWVRLRPRKVSPIAVIGVIDRLLRQTHPQRVVISRFEPEGWRSTLYSTQKAAAGALYPLADSDSRRRATSFHSRARDLRLPFQDACLERVFDAWRSDKRLPSDVSRWAPPELRDRLVVLSPGAGAASAHLTISHLGMGFGVIPKAWAQAARGLYLEDHPDVHYGEWAARGYRRSIAGGVPLFDDIDADVDVGASYKRSRYRRLILPFRDESGNPCVLGTSVVDPSLDLRSEGSHVR